MKCFRFDFDEDEWRPCGCTEFLLAFCVSVCVCVCGFCLECEYYSVLLSRIRLLSSYSRQRLLKSTCRFHVTLKRVIYDTRFCVVALYDVCVRAWFVLFTCSVLGRD